MLVRVLPPRKGLSLYVRAKFVSDTLGRFLTSADGDVTTAHTPHMQQDDDGTQREIEHDMRMVSALVRISKCVAVMLAGFVIGIICRFEGVKNLSIASYYFLPDSYF